MKKKIIYIIFLIVVMIDQLTKMLVIKNINLLESVVVIPNFFSIHYIQNTGAAWGIFGKYTFLLTIISALAFIIINRFLLSVDKFNKLSVTAYGLLLGGILGNFIDRMFYNYVIDFFDFTIFGYNFPVFNIADIAIVIGVILFILDIIRGEVYEFKSRNRKDKN